MNTKHTPGPWFTCKEPFEDQVCSMFEYAKAREQGMDDGDACSESLICEMGGNKANAEFIVRACNAHDEMVEALECIARGITNGQKERGETFQSIAVEALKKAKGEA